MDTLLRKFHCLTHESHIQSSQRPICLQHFPKNSGLSCSAVKTVLPNCIIFQLRKHDRVQVMWVFYKLTVSHLTPYMCLRKSHEEYLPVMQTRCFVTIFVPLTRSLLNCGVRCHTQKSPKWKGTWNFYACCVICVGFMTS
jgi:hypothetical protein